jgi:hypothetical protein
VPSLENWDGEIIYGYNHTALPAHPTVLLQHNLIKAKCAIYMIVYIHVQADIHVYTKLASKLKNVNLGMTPRSINDDFFTLFPIIAFLIFLTEESLTECS